MADLTVHHVMMALAFAFKSKTGKEVALLAARHKKTAGNIFLACDESGRYPGHTAVVNLIQHLFQGMSWDVLTDPHIYSTARPGPSDLGIFIEQVKQSGQNGDPRLFFPDLGGVVASVIEARPTKLAAGCLNVKAVHGYPSGKNGGYFPSFFSAWSRLSGAKLTKKPPAITLDGDSFLIASKQEVDIAELLNVPKQTERSVQCRFGVVSYSVGTNGSPSFELLGDIGVSKTYGTLSGPSKVLFDSIFGLATYGLAAKLAAPLGKSGEHQKVGAILASERGEILSWGVDFSATFHAEVSTIKLLQKTYTKPLLPDNCRLYTSLEPCFMCSGLLDAYGRSKGFVVLYGQEDPAVRQVAQTFLKNHGFIREAKATIPYPWKPKVTFAEKLDGKGQMLGNFDQKTFAKSVMQQMSMETFNRRFAKAILGFGFLVSAVGQVQDELEAQLLAQAWLNALGLLVRVHGLSEDELIRKAAEYMTKTRGMNPLRLKLEGEKYEKQLRDPKKYQKIAGQIFAQ